jgi:hypothetical protein
MKDEELQKEETELDRVVRESFEELVPFSILPGSVRIVVPS